MTAFLPGNGRGQGWRRQRCASTIVHARLLYNSGYDPSLSYFSVGLLLHAMCVKDAIEKGIEYFDFLRGPEPYKAHLGGIQKSLYRMVVKTKLEPRKHAAFVSFHACPLAAPGQGKSGGMNVYVRELSRAIG